MEPDKLLHNVSEDSQAPLVESLQQNLPRDAEYVVAGMPLAGENWIVATSALPGRSNEPVTLLKINRNMLPDGDGLHSETIPLMISANDREQIVQAFQEGGRDAAEVLVREYINRIVHGVIN